jgi:hypothetical protein
MFIARLIHIIRTHAQIQKGLEMLLIEFLIWIKIYVVQLNIIHFDRCDKMIYKIY